MPLDFPNSPNDGQAFARFTYDSTTGAWRARDASVAPGGTIDFPDSPSNGDTYSGFTYDSTSGTWKNVSSILPSGYDFQYLVVAGGGGGGSSPGGYASGGGGGGGVATGNMYVNPSTFTVTVGAGGSITGASGEDSVFSIVESKGGTRGGNLTANGGNLNGGASGAPTAFAGGSGQDFEGGGGGGASQVGESAPNIYTSGDGGDGVVSDITGTPTYYGGGGGGGNSTIFGRGGSPGTGGLGGGGNGGKNYTAGSGTANTGGGGGGAGHDGGSYTGGSGGSGIVVLKYPVGATLTIGGSLTSSTVTSGDYKITSFTAGSDTVTVV